MFRPCALTPALRCTQPDVAGLVWQAYGEICVPPAQLHDLCVNLCGCCVTQSGGNSATLFSGLANPATSSGAAAGGIGAGAPGSATGGFGRTGGSPTASGGSAKGLAEGSAPLAPSLLRDAVIQQAKKVLLLRSSRL